MVGVSHSEIPASVSPPAVLFVPQLHHKICSEVAKSDELCFQWVMRTIKEHSVKWHWLIYISRSFVAAFVPSKQTQWRLWPYLFILCDKNQEFPQAFRGMNHTRDVIWLKIVKKRQNNHPKLLISVDSCFKMCFLFILPSFQSGLTNQTLTSLSLFKSLHSQSIHIVIFYEIFSYKYWIEQRDTFPRACCATLARAMHKHMSADAL